MGLRAGRWVLASVLLTFGKTAIPALSKTGAPQPALVPDRLVMLPAKRLGAFLFHPQPCLLKISLGRKRVAGLGNHLKAQVSLRLGEAGGRERG